MTQGELLALRSVVETLKAGAAEGAGERSAAADDLRAGDRHTPPPRAQPASISPTFRRGPASTEQSRHSPSLGNGAGLALGMPPALPAVVPPSLEPAEPSREAERCISELLDCLPDTPESRRLASAAKAALPQSPPLPLSPAGRLDGSGAVGGEGAGEASGSEASESGLGLGSSGLLPEHVPTADLSEATGDGVRGLLPMEGGFEIQFARGQLGAGVAAASDPRWEQYWHRWEGHKERWGSQASAVVTTIEISDADSESIATETETDLASEPEELLQLTDHGQEEEEKETETEDGASSSSSSDDDLPPRLREVNLRLQSIAQVESASAIKTALPEDTEMAGMAGASFDGVHGQHEDEEDVADGQESFWAEYQAKYGAVDEDLEGFEEEDYSEEELAPPAAHQRRATAALEHRAGFDEAAGERQKPEEKLPVAVGAVRRRKVRITRVKKRPAAAAAVAGAL